MDYLLNLPKHQEGGFSFDNFKRNQYLEEKKLAKLPKAIKTGTTIAGTIFKDGVVLGADTRATEGPIVANKNCLKIHYLAPNMRCCGAGTAADCDEVTNMIGSELELIRLNTGRECRVVNAVTLAVNHLFYYGGYIGAYLIIGGVDCKGPHIVNVSADGTQMWLPFYSTGSGSLAATAVLESGYRDNLPLEEAKSLVVKAIEGGIYNDLGSGSNVDLCVITRGKTEFYRNYVSKNKKMFSLSEAYNFPAGTTKVLKEHVSKLSEVKVEDSAVPMEML